MVEASRAVGPWREAVRAEAQRELFGADVDRPDLTGWSMTEMAVSLTAVFLLPRPASHYGTGRNASQVRASAPRWPGVRPDLDKLLRSTLDGLTDAGVWRDDSQVVSISAAKVYAKNGDTPGVIIEVEGAET
jgi:Holliday junction resolvase RusA-like endonuclease